MKKLKQFQGWLFGAVIVAAAVSFTLLYMNQMPKIEKPNVDKLPSSLEDWALENSDLTGRPLREDKSIYPEEPDNKIYDVYLNVFPTKDETGKMLDFSSFGLHSARDHTYNPVLKCNIQILDEGKSLDPTVITDVPNATIRVRGNSSRGDLFKSYKIKAMGNDDLFQGQNSLNINKHSEDETKITTKLCADLITDMDHMVSYRTNFMRVWIRDCSLPDSQQQYQYYGLFTNIEQPNKRFLEARSLSSDCEMYKARDFSFAQSEKLRDVTDPEYSVEEFEEILTIRESDSHKKLLEMLDAVNDTTRDFNEVFNTYFNEDNYLTWLAFSVLVGANDILNHNFILYSPNNSMTWYLIPWDFDSNLQEPSSYYAPSLLGGQKLNMVVLHRRFLRMPGSLEKLDGRIRELLETAMSPDRITELTNQYLPVLEKTIPLYPDLELLLGTPATVYDRIQNYNSLLQHNYQTFQEAFEFPAPMYVEMPKKNPDGTLQLRWEPSYSYQGRTITYDVRIYDNYTKEHVLFEKNDLIDVECIADVNLAPGTYYLEVRPVDSAGHEQYSLEHYEFAGVRFIYKNGLLEFTVE